jgi:hypothetical protein
VRAVQQEKSNRFGGPLLLSTLESRTLRSSAGESRKIPRRRLHISYECEHCKPIPVCGREELRKIATPDTSMPLFAFCSSTNYLGVGLVLVVAVHGALELEG